VTELACLRCGSQVGLHICAHKSQAGRRDPEPQPTDGPDYHAEYAAWVRRRAK